jgi:hypothetical protein
MPAWRGFLRAIFATTCMRGGAAAINMGENAKIPVFMRLIPD